MEHIMDLPLFWQLQLKGYRGYNLSDFKRAGSLGWEFPRRYLKLEVSGFEPDFVSNFPGFEAREGSLSHALLCQFVGGFSFLLYILNLVESLLESWKEGLSEEWVGLWFISHD